MSSTTSAWYIGWKLSKRARRLVILRSRVTRLRVDELLGDVAAHLDRSADVHAGDAEGRDDLALQRLVHRQTGDPTDHLADEPAVGEA